MQKSNFDHSVKCPNRPFGALGAGGMLFGGEDKKATCPSVQWGYMFRHAVPRCSYRQN